MAKYIKQEFKSIHGEGEASAYYRMETSRRVTMAEFVKEISIPGYGISEATAVQVLSQAATSLARLMAHGCAVTIDGIGTFKATIGVCEDKEQDGVGDVEDVRDEDYVPHILKDSKGKGFRLYVNIVDPHTNYNANYIDNNPHGPYYTEYQCGTIPPSATPMSWRRRVDTAKLAMPRYTANTSTPREKSTCNKLSSGIPSAARETMKPRIQENNVHHQNSERRARPLNTNDFFMQVVTASTKPIRVVSIISYLFKLYNISRSAAGHLHVEWHPHSYRVV